MYAQLTRDCAKTVGGGSASTKGHLQPFGAHAPPSGAVEELPVLPSPEAIAGGGSVGYMAALRQLTAGLPPTVLCKSGGESVVTSEI